MVTIKAALIGAAMAATVGMAGSASAQLGGGVQSATFTANASNSSPSPAPTTGFAVVQSFDACSVGSCTGMSGTYHIFTGNQPNTGTIPYGGDTTPYLAVLSTDNNPVATYTFATPATSIQFDWGTAASTDKLTILTTTGSYAYTVPNSDVPGGANYNMNGLFTATASAGSLITGLQFSATQNSFEVENIAVATPEPATWGMMILGFGMVGFAMRRAARRSDEKFNAKIKRIAEGAIA